MQLPPSVTTITRGETEIYIIGTAHVSQQSVDDVKNVIEIVRPDSICIELCDARYHSLRNKDAWKKMDIFKVFKEKKVLFLVAQLILGSFYRKLGKQLEVTPGAEMIQGADEAESRGIPLILADRNIEITLRRVWGGLSFWKKSILLASVLPSLFYKEEEIDSAAIEKLKEQDNLEAAMEEMAKEFPAVRARLIHERDIYLAEKIKTAPGKRVVAVVGAGHVAGIKERLFEEHSLDEISTIPAPSIWPKLINYLIPLTIILVFVLSALSGHQEQVVSNLRIWILCHVTFGILGGIAALAHPVTILVSGFVAPITTLLPQIPSGLITGLVEAHYKRPTVEDLENVPEATESLKGWWSNGFTHLLVVFFLTSLGSATGLWVSIILMGGSISNIFTGNWKIFVGAFAALVILLLLFPESKKKTSAHA